MVVLLLVEHSAGLHQAFIGFPGVMRICQGHESQCGKRGRLYVWLQCTVGPMQRVEPKWLQT
eukprot:7514342-Lingulodinium_polyedra.AAC.1